MSSFAHHRFSWITAAVVVVLAAAAFAQTSLQIGSPNTAIADPPVPRPSTQPCVVTLFQNYKFANFSPKSFQYTPPANCPGPWQKVVFEANFLVTAGRQFDRTANMWIGGTNVYFGTTAEPSHTVSRHWHVERDLTDYSVLFTMPQAGEVDLGNLVNDTYTSVLFGTAYLQFYPLASGGAAPTVADVVLPLSAGPTGGTVILSSTSSQLAQTFTLPTNVERAYLDVFAQSQSQDEFWYSCVPDDVAGELQSCPGTAFRESEVTIDGQPAGVAPVYPWIYTGGIDPYLWRPIPGVQTLNFVPYRVDLSPFAGVLSDGQPHQVALNVFNADNYFSATATLLIYEDHASTQVTGSVIDNNIGTPNPSVVENLDTSGGNVTGTVSTTSSRKFSVSGYVNTSHGKVVTEVSQKIDFSNVQTFDITASEYVQDISQDTKIASRTITRSNAGVQQDSKAFDWPLTADISLPFYPDGSFAQATTIQQAYNASEVMTQNGQQTFWSVLSDQVQPADTLLFDSSGNLVGNQGQKNTQSYFTQNSTGYCYTKTITAANGVLTGISTGAGCH